MKRFAETLSYAHPYILMVVFALVVLVAPGCSTASATASGGTRNFATTAVTTAGGAYIGAKEGNGKARDAAVGAAAGFVAGEAIGYFNNKAQREAFQAGYEKGQSNAVKQQYWLARDNQRARSEDGYEESLYEIEVPSSDRGGVRREPTKRVIRVVMPKEGT